MTPTQPPIASPHPPPPTPTTQSHTHTQTRTKQNFDLKYKVFSSTTTSDNISLNLAGIYHRKRRKNIMYYTEYIIVKEYTNGTVSIGEEVMY